MDLQMFCIELPVETLRLFQRFFYLPRIRQHIASVNIDRQLPLLIQLAQIRIDHLMDIVV